MRAIFIFSLHIRYVFACAAQCLQNEREGIKVLKYSVSFYPGFMAP